VPAAAPASTAAAEIEHQVGGERRGGRRGRPAGRRAITALRRSQSTSVVAAGAAGQGDGEQDLELLELGDRGDRAWVRARTGWRAGRRCRLRVGPAGEVLPANRLPLRRPRVGRCTAVVAMAEREAVSSRASFPQVIRPSLTASALSRARRGRWARKGDDPDPTGCHNEVARSTDEPLAHA